MQRIQASSEGAPQQTSPPRQRQPALGSLAIQSFASFRSRTSSNPPLVAVQSPVRRKPLPIGSPVVDHAPASQSNTRTSTVHDKHNTPSHQGLRRPDTILSPPLTEDDLFVPRNLDE